MHIYKVDAQQQTNKQGFKIGVCSSHTWVIFLQYIQYTFDKKYHSTTKERGLFTD